MAEGSGEEENTFSFHGYLRNHERKFEDGSDEVEKNSFKSYFGLGKTETVEKKAFIDNYGPGKHSRLYYS